jgi:glycine dehydrogenase
MNPTNRDLLNPTDQFAHRHLGPRDEDITFMLADLGLSTLDELIYETIPDAIRMDGDLKLPPARSEHETLADLRQLASQNKLYRSYIGMGYSNTHTPPVILRNVMENPGWYTQYTPYQAEIAQGRLEALLNFQTMITDLTGMEIANASLLDEGTAAAEGMFLAYHAKPRKSTANTFFVSELCHPQTIAVVQTRADAIGVDVLVGDHVSTDLADCFGVLLQYPTTHGDIFDYEAFCSQAHAADVLVVVARRVRPRCGWPRRRRRRDRRRRPSPRFRSRGRS